MWRSRKAEEIKIIQEEEGKVTQDKRSVSDEGVAQAKKESQPSSAGGQNTKASPVWQMQKGLYFQPMAEAIQPPVRETWTVKTKAIQ